jgi:hypothetical protein
MEDDGSEYDFHVYTSLSSGMVRIWSGARAGKNICTFKVNESAVLHMHYDSENSWLIAVLHTAVEVWNPQYRYRCSLAQGAPRWKLPVLHSAISTSVWVGVHRMLAGSSASSLAIFGFKTLKHNMFLRAHRSHALLLSLALIIASLNMLAIHPFAVGFDNGKVVLARITRSSGKGVVNHSDIKDQACIVLMHSLDTGNSSPIASIRFNFSGENMLLCASALVCQLPACSCLSRHKGGRMR